MDAGEATAAELARAYLDRIAALDAGGPRLHAVLELNPQALTDASALDDERKRTGPRSPLHGVCVLLKDNIDVAGLHNTAGSLALLDARPHTDSKVAAKLQAAGAVLLGKTNLSEWANFRSDSSSSGWSARGGQTRNPHVLSITPSGSSSGSATSVAAALCAVAVGSETDGSIVSPADVQGIVGLKPTVGLVSRAGIIPIMSSQDTAGPMGRTVSDVAAVLQVIAGRDIECDSATRAQPPGLLPDYMAALSCTGLQGARIGVLRHHFDKPIVAVPVGVGTTPQTLAGREETKSIWETTVFAPFAQAGAVIMDGLQLWGEGQVQKLGWQSEDDVRKEYAGAMGFEFVNGIESFLTSPTTKRRLEPLLEGSGFMPRSVHDLIDFNLDHKEDELALFGQDRWLNAVEHVARTTSAQHEKVASRLKALGGDSGIAHLLDAHKLDALICPASCASYPASLCGYPVLCVPAGVLRGVPFGLGLIGRPWSEETLLRFGYAFEQRTHALRRPKFLPELETTGGESGGCGRPRAWGCSCCSLTMPKI